MNEKILEKYNQYLCQKYRKHNTIYTANNQIKLFLQYIKKPHDKITKRDLNKWHEYIKKAFKPNGNLRRIVSVNQFFKWLRKPKMKLPIPHPERTNKKVLNKEELERYIEASKTDPLDYMVALLQIDGLIRPGEMGNIKISNRFYRYEAILRRHKNR